MTTKERIVYLDTARALCMLWIVGVWHLTSSVEGFTPFTSPYMHCVIVTVLGTFTFISSYFMSEKVKNKSQILEFYKGRLIRFYPLYLISSIIMFCAYIISRNESMMNPRQLILSIFGISCLIGPSPITLWYFSMLIYFYALTPFVETATNRGLKAFLVLLGYFVVILSVNFFNGDQRVLIHYPIYFLGIIKGKELVTWYRRINKKLMPITLNILIFAGLCIAYANTKGQILNTIIEIGIGLSGTGILLTFSELLTNGWNSKLFIWLSYASMCAYLFHTQYYWILRLLIGKFPLGLTYLVIVPSLLVISWFMQKSYDRVIDYITK
jgi:peptidoglycan/LPS O-acetylase OafA/YrhL